MALKVLDVPRQKRNEGPKRNDTSVKIDADVVRLAKSVAAFRDIYLAAYLTEILRPIVTKEFNEMHRKGGKE